MNEIKKQKQKKGPCVLLSYRDTSDLFKNTIPSASITQQCTRTDVIISFVNHIGGRAEV